MKEFNALAGERVLDLTDEKGMFCSRLLADMGAEVIRIEKPGAELKRSPFFVANNLGKRSVTLNLEVEAGQALFKRLVSATDVVVESYPPGYLVALALDYPELSRINPRLILASITNFGQSGPYRDYRANDMVASALGGQMYVCGEPQLPPVKPYGSQTYYSACLFAAVGILLSLWHRHTSGRGQHLDISIQECVAATLDHVLVRYFYQRVIAGRQGNLYWNNAFRIFPCRDGYILLSLFHQWETLVEWLEAEGATEDLTSKAWRDREERVKHLEHIIEVLERWTKSHAVAELVEKGQLMHFPWAKVSSILDLLHSPQLRERDFFLEVESPESAQKHKFPGALAKLSGSPWQVGNRVPAPGEHNIEVFQSELRLAKLEIETLVKEGAI